MNKRQAKKILFRYRITGNQPEIYTKYQIQTAFNIQYPQKDRTLLPGLITAIGKNDFTYTVNYAVKAKPKRIKVNIQIDESLPPHGLVAGKTLTYPMPSGKYRYIKSNNS